MDELAQVVLLIVFAALVVNLVLHGWGGVGDWFRSKFLGHETRTA
jgi:hypothetical protein